MSSTSPAETSHLLYIRVLRNSSKGFWEINTISKTALFRDNTHKRINNKKIDDYHEFYTTVMDFLKGGLKIQYIKEIIPDVKYIYGDELFCTWSTDGVVSTDPNRQIHCQKPAVVYRNGMPYCSDHSNINF